MGQAFNNFFSIKTSLGEWTFWDLLALHSNERAGNDLSMYYRHLQKEVLIHEVVVIGYLRHAFTMMWSG